MIGCPKFGSHRTGVSDIMAVQINLLKNGQKKNNNFAKMINTQSATE